MGARFLKQAYVRNNYDSVINATFLLKDETDRMMQVTRATSSQIVKLCVLPMFYEPWAAEVCRRVIVNASWALRVCTVVASGSHVGYSFL